MYLDVAAQMGQSCETYYSVRDIEAGANGGCRKQAGILDYSASTYLNVMLQDTAAGDDSASAYFRMRPDK